MLDICYILCLSLYLITISAGMAVLTRTLIKMALVLNREKV